MSDEQDAERWRYFADAATRERSSNGDNAFIRYVGPWVVARDSNEADEEGHPFLDPGTPDEWIDADMEENRISPTTDREGKNDG